MYLTQSHTPYMVRLILAVFVAVEYKLCGKIYALPSRFGTKTGKTNSNGRMRRVTRNRPSVYPVGPDQARDSWHHQRAHSVTVGLWYIPLYMVSTFTTIG